jgi:hypothetical protein
MIERRRLAGALLLAAAVWTWFIWVVRIINIAGNGHSAAFVAVHVGLAAVSLLLAVPVGYVGLRLLRS